MSLVVATRSVDTPPAQENNEEFVPNDSGGIDSVENLEPVEDGDSTVLSALGIDDMVQNLPDEDLGNLRDTRAYVEGIMKERGLPKTVGGYKKALEYVKEKLDIDAEAEPAFVLNKVGGALRAWRGLSFITDAGEKRKIFMKMARMQSGDDMQSYLLSVMENKKVWQ